MLFGLQGWGQFLRLGVPSCLMLCLEWWFFEMSSLLSGLLPNPQASLAVFGICMQIMELSSMIAHGISVAVRTRVSNLLGVLHLASVAYFIQCLVWMSVSQSFGPPSLCHVLIPWQSRIITFHAYMASCHCLAWPAGAGESAGAEQAVKISLAACWALLLLVLSALLHFRERIAAAFLPNAAPNSLELVALNTCILLGITGSVGDWTNAVLGAALQGAGKQKLGAQIYAATHWLLGPVLLHIFAFRLSWGVTGIWAAIALVNNVQSGFMLVLFSLPCSCCRILCFSEPTTLWIQQACISHR
jgi:Na+-driven multidrug efflux pump